MGSFSHCFFAGYPLFAVKNDYVLQVLQLIFHPNDYIEEKRKFKSRSRLVWGDAYENMEGDFLFTGYRQQAKACRERLEIFGMSSKVAKSDFLTAKKLARDELHYEFDIGKIRYEDYLKEIADIIERGDVSYDKLHVSFRESLIADELSIYGQSLAAYIYAVLSTVRDDSIIEYDLSDVIYGGWVKSVSDFDAVPEKIIVLAEGKTDVEFISKSIEIYCPWVSDYYHFIDFDEFKIETNASALVKLITTFAAANVKHPIIALFDNDTTGLMEMKKLKGLSLPDNIRVLKYPDIKLARRYPAQGPGRIQRTNVNGLACGIEMYLGQDVLTKDDGLIPVRWSSFNERERKYQGEISDKKYVQEAFRQKMNDGFPPLWDEMRVLLNVIFTAFK